LNKSSSPGFIRTAWVCGASSLQRLRKTAGCPFCSTNIQKWLGITASRQGEDISIVIADHGDGIPADEMRHVQRKFYRGRRARSDGSGLGLALAERIIRDHGGSWTLHSSIGQGTTVTILLPAAAS